MLTLALWHTIREDLLSMPLHGYKMGSYVRLTGHIEEI